MNQRKSLIFIEISYEKGKKKEKREKVNGETSLRGKDESHR